MAKQKRYSAQLKFQVVLESLVRAWKPRAVSGEERRLRG